MCHRFFGYLHLIPRRFGVVLKSAMATEERLFCSEIQVEVNLLQLSVGVVGYLLHGRSIVQIGNGNFSI